MCISISFFTLSIRFGGKFRVVDSLGSVGSFIKVSDTSGISKTY